MRDIKKLNILPADKYPKATEHIKDMIDFIKLIEKNGYTYRIKDGIYFDTSKLQDYGKLARLKIDQLKHGIRIKTEGKKNPTDFALWKFSPKDKKRQMEWESPWGRGFPGWHIECSVMSTKYLGKYFDIHCGGIDHIPVHHTNEMAQCEAALGTEQAKWWIHGEFLVMKEDKMSKSKGNFITLTDLEEKGYPALSYRYLCLTTHYRKRLIFSWEAMDSAKKAYMRLKNWFLDVKEAEPVHNKNTEKYRKEFHKAINNDLDMPKALSITWEMLRSSLSKGEKHYLLKEFDKVLGLKLDKEEKIDIPDEIKKLVEEREKYRKEKKYREADRIRNIIKEKGYIIDDTPMGPRIRKI